MTEEEERKKEKVGVRICWINQQIKNLEKKIPISTDTFPKIAYLPDVRALCDATLWRDSITSTFQAQVELDGVVVVHPGCEEVSLWDLMRILTFSFYEHI